MAAFSDKNTPSESTGRIFPTRKGQARVRKNAQEIADAGSNPEAYYSRRSNPNKGRFGGKTTCKAARKPGKAFKNK